MDPVSLHPIGVVRSTLRSRGDAPRQADLGAPEARLELDPRFADALRRVSPGMDLLVLTWLHQANRDELLTHPMGDETIPLTGVFATRSPDRPNPIGLHRVTVVDVEPPATLRVAAV